MTDPILVLAWLVLAHLTSDFILQTATIARAKAGPARQAVGGLFAHAVIVAVCLVPVGLAYGAPGWGLVVFTAISHVMIDRSKVLLTRRAAASALAAANRRREAPQPPDHLGRAWTARPAAWFVVDQVAHLAIAVGLWAFLLVPNAPLSGWRSTIDGWLGIWDRAVVHDVVSMAVVLASLAIANILAAAHFVAILVRPVEEAEGEMRWGGRAAPPVVAGDLSGGGAPPVRRWTLRIGMFDAARIEAVADRPSARATDSEAELGGSAGQASPAAPAARIGATIGILERILIVVFVLTGSEAAIGFVVAAKTLARFRLLDDRDFAEYYLLGTLASVAVAIVTALIGRAALGALLA